MKRIYLYLLSAATVAVTILFILLWLIIPGFPLLVVLFLPPIIWWSSRTSWRQPVEEREEAATSWAGRPASTPSGYPLDRPLRFCPNCGKRLLEPQEAYCPRCGTPLHEEE